MACLDSHHAPYGVVASGENDRELIGLSVAGDFQLFHTMLLAGRRVRKETLGRKVLGFKPCIRCVFQGAREAKATIRCGSVRTIQ